MPPVIADVRLDVNAVDYAIVALYFVITGLAFVSANLGATEILGNGANGAQYGYATFNYYRIGAIPAMVFRGLVMMPFYYGSRVRSSSTRSARRRSGSCSASASS